MDLTAKSAYRLYRVLWTGLDWLYPPRCGGCGCPGSRWCEECQHTTRKIRAPVCRYCGCPLVGKEVCYHCLEGRPLLTAIRSWAIYMGPLQNSIRRLKYKGDLALGEALSRPLITMVSALNWSLDIISSIPISKTHHTKRGYNQSALLAYPLALSSGIKYCPDVLTKTREVRSQVGLSREERYLNVSGAFDGNPQFAMGKSVLLVDDVITSGATLNACAQALLDAGARQVYGVTLARAELTL